MSGTKAGSGDRSQDFCWVQCKKGRYCLADSDKTVSHPKSLVKSSTFRCRSLSIMTGKTVFPLVFGALWRRRSPMTSAKSVWRWVVGPGNILLTSWTLSKNKAAWCTLQVHMDLFLRCSRILNSCSELRTTTGNRHALLVLLDFKLAF